MAGLRGNQAYWAWAKQSAKGTPASVGVHKTPFSGGSIGPTRSVAQLSETDTSRDEGVSYVEVNGLEGSPECYVRDTNIHSLLDLVLGSTVSSGAGPYVHTATPAAALPYVTFWRGVGDTLFERFEDCMVSELTISADAGGPLTASLSVMGLNTTRLTSDVWSAVPLASAGVYNYNEATVTAHGGATALISNFELTISNNVSTQQTDSITPYDVVPGQRSVTVGYDMIFETLAAYNEFNYGGTSGTTQGSAITTTALNFAFAKGAGAIEFDIPNAAVEEFPVEPDPGGDPIVASVRTRAQRVTGTPLITTEVTNAKATVAA